MTESSQHFAVKSTYASRSNSPGTHPLTSYLFRLMELKSSNLCLSADVQTARELLNLADKVGPYIVVLKTHYDLVSGWDFHPQSGTGAKLAALARQHGFLIFEDRKFGDVGSTIQKQYIGGSARIIDWAHITNLNMVPGPATVTVLAEAAAKWKERINYGVKTSVSAGNPYPEDSNGVEFRKSTSKPPVETSNSHDSRGSEERKGSIVSITTVTQSYEPVDSPRASKYMCGEGDYVFPGIEEAPSDRGLLILAQMSSAGNFMNAEYTSACVKVARENRNFVMGFVAQQSLNSDPEDNFIVMTPGCKFPPEDESGVTAINGDSLGQQYNTPDEIVGSLGCDIIIVGRGIIKAGNPQAEAERYRKAAWNSYLSRLS